MQARCMSICTNEQGRRRGREKESEKRGKMGKAEWEEKEGGSN